MVSATTTALFGAYDLMDKLKTHEYRVTALRKHDWHSGWAKEAAELLCGAETIINPSTRHFCAFFAAQHLYSHAT